MRKVTVETLKKMGFIGFQLHTMTGNLLEAQYPLDNFAWTLNNRPDRIRTVNNDIGGNVRLFIENENWVSKTNTEIFIERPMTEQELIEADARLAEMGITVNRGKPSLNDVIADAQNRPAQPTLNEQFKNVARRAGVDGVSVNARVDERDR